MKFEINTPTRNSVFEKVPVVVKKGRTGIARYTIFGGPANGYWHYGRTGKRRCEIPEKYYPELDRLFAELEKGKEERQK